MPIQILLIVSTVFMHFICLNQEPNKVYILYLFVMHFKIFNGSFLLFFTITFLRRNLFICPEEWSTFWIWLTASSWCYLTSSAKPCLSYFIGATDLEAWLDCLIWQEYFIGGSVYFLMRHIREAHNA